MILSSVTIRSSMNFLLIGSLKSAVSLKIVSFSCLLCSCISYLDCISLLVVPLSILLLLHFQMRFAFTENLRQEKREQECCSEWIPASCWCYCCHQIFDVRIWTYYDTHVLTSTFWFCVCGCTHYRTAEFKTRKDYRFPAFCLGGVARYLGLQGRYWFIWDIRWLKNMHKW